MRHRREGKHRRGAIHAKRAGTRQAAGKGVSVNGAQHVLGVFGKDYELRESGLRLCERGAGIAKKKAVVATARKMAVTMVAVWKSGEAYQPYRKVA